MHSAPLSSPRSLTLGLLVAGLLGLPEDERDLSVADLSGQAEDAAAAETSTP